MGAFGSGDYCVQGSGLHLVQVVTPMNMASGQVLIGSDMVAMRL
jgi:hypothetical protein